MSDVKKDKFGVAVAIGDYVAYSQSGSSSPVVYMGVIIRETPKKVIIQDLHEIEHWGKNVGKFKVTGGKDSGATINISNCPLLIPNILKNYIAPFRHLSDDQIQNLIGMFESPDKENVQLAKDLMETYKNQVSA